MHIRIYIFIYNTHAHLCAYIGLSMYVYVCVYNLTIHITIYKWRSFLERDKERGPKKIFIRDRERERGGRGKERKVCNCVFLYESEIGS